MRIAEKMWEMYTLMGDTQKTNKTDKWVGGGGGSTNSRNQSRTSPYGAEIIIRGGKGPVDCTDDHN